MIMVHRWLLKSIMWQVLAAYMLATSIDSDTVQDRYSVLIDSGSTGSRAYVYKFSSEAPINTMQEVSQQRITPGLSSYADNVEGAITHVSQLVDFIQSVLDESLWSQTPIALKATAGVRALQGRDQVQLIDSARTVLQRSGFHFDPHETRVISGGEEALFAFLAVNSAFIADANRRQEGAQSSNQSAEFDDFRMGAADLGGASTQISFLVNSAIAVSEISNPTTTAVVGVDGNKIDSSNAQLNHDGTSVSSSNSNGSSYEMDPFGWLSSFNLQVLGLKGFNSQLHNGFNKYVESACRPDYLFELPGLEETVGVVARSMNGLGLVAAMDALLPSVEDLTAAAAAAEEVKRNFGSISLNPKFSNLLIEIAYSHVGSDSDLDHGLWVEDREEEVVDALLTQWVSAENKTDEMNNSSASEGLHKKFEKKFQEVVSYLANSLFALKGGSETTAVVTAAKAAAATADSTTATGTEGATRIKATSLLDVVELQDQFNPCLAPGIPFPFLRDGAAEEVFLHGSGDFFQCVTLIKHLLREVAGEEIACMKTMRPATIIGMDNFPKVLEVLHLSNEEHVSPLQIKEAGSKICRRSWLDIRAEFPDFMPYRAQRACFGASYVYAFMTEVYRIPEEDTTSFLPLETMGPYTLGWPLGAAVSSALRLNIREHDSSLRENFFYFL